MRPGARPPDSAAVDLFGKARRLHEFRRKTHVILLWDPTATAAQREQWARKRTEEGQRWTWLQAEALVPAEPLSQVDPGTYLISRWGYVIAVHPPGGWDMDRVEKDLLTFESQDACGIKSQE